LKTFAEQIIDFNAQLHYAGTLPEGIRIMNPFQDQMASELSASFYRKYYNDRLARRLILGINPGRFGGGTTGIPFTDPKRLVELCGIPFQGKLLHEPSSVFIYQVIQAFGGPNAFYSQFYINSVCPLGFTNVSELGKETNYNYYDSKELQNNIVGFIVQSIQKQLEFPLDRETCFCLGTGKNWSFLDQLNGKYKFFKRIIPLDHPRFVMQYKAKSISVYVEKYLQLLTS
jgi:hypothetical protein